MSGSIFKFESEPGFTEFPSAALDRTGIVSLVEPPNPWARISEIAAKVGVKPTEYGHPATITAMGADGQAYDVWEVVARVLDRLDSAAG